MTLSIQNRILTAIYISTLLLVSLGTCCVYDRRLDVVNAMERLRELRTAEERFLQATGHYGDLDQLVQRHLLTQDLADGVDQGYNFKLETNGTEFMVIAAPDGNNVDAVGTSFYLDQTGIIRASFEPGVTADGASEPIRNQQ